MRIKYSLDLTHDPDHILGFREVQVLSLLETHSMFSTYATLVIPDKSHHKGIDQVIETLLEAVVVIAYNTAVQV